MAVKYLIGIIHEHFTILIKISEVLCFTLKTNSCNEPVIWNPRIHPPFGLERGIHFLCKWKRVNWVPGDNSAWCFPPLLLFHTHTWYSICKTTYYCKRNTQVKRHSWQLWSKNIHFERLANLSCKVSSMHNESQNIFILEAVSLILLDKLTMKHNRQLVQ